MDSFDKLNGEWKSAVEGMTFLGEPVHNMTAEQLLSVVGYLITEKQRVEAELKGLRLSVYSRCPVDKWKPEVK